jgi:AbrB family looped-hinge helix DNA binding protein
MKKYPKIVQCDSRGQIVIPKDIRTELGIREGSGFFMYSVGDEGILLTKIDAKELGDHTQVLGELDEKADRIRLSKKKLAKSVQEYRKTKEGNLEVV